MGPLTLESAALWGSMARDGERGARNRAEIQKSISNLIASGWGGAEKERGQGRIPVLFYLKKQHFDLTLWHIVYISHFYWSVSQWQEKLQWEQSYFQIQDHTTTVSLLLSEKTWCVRKRVSHKWEIPLWSFSFQLCACFCQNLHTVIMCNLGVAATSLRDANKDIIPLAGAVRSDLFGKSLGHFTVGGGLGLDVEKEHVYVNVRGFQLALLNEQALD